MAKGAAVCSFAEGELLLALFKCPGPWGGSGGLQWYSITHKSGLSISLVMTKVHTKCM